MSTRSFIGILNPAPSTSITGIYCHWSGQPTQNGQKLLDSYNSEELARALATSGTLSALGETPKDNVTHTYKDRVHLQNESSTDDYDYYYIWVNGEWLCTDMETHGYVVIEEAQKIYTFDAIKRLFSKYAEICPRLENGYINWEAVKLQEEYKTFETKLNSLHFVEFAPYDFNTVSPQNRTLKIDFKYKNEYFTL